MSYCKYRPVEGGSPVCKRCGRPWDAAEPNRTCEMPGLGRRALNLVGAVARHVADGLGEVGEGEYEARLRTCEGCERRTESWTCAHPKCGCYLIKKAWWASERCPEGKWPGEENAVKPSPAGNCGCSKGGGPTS